MRRLVALAAIACACTGAWAQQEEADLDGDFSAAMATAAATADAMAAENTPLKRLETGIASWYGKQFHGRKTANGERFDMGALTAAHPSLPFGSWVRVRDLVSGRSVDVRINDRGPYIKRRIIDLSQAAARALGVSGTHQVELSVLDKQIR